MSSNTKMKLLNSKNKYNIINTLSTNNSNKCKF